MTNHDIWAYTANPLVQYGSAANVGSAYLITLFASRGLVSIYNGQEQGTSQSLDFNNALHGELDIDAANKNKVVEIFHKCGGKVFVGAGALFTEGAIRYCATGDEFAIVRELGGRKIGLFVGGGQGGSSCHTELDASSELNNVIFTTSVGKGVQIRSNFPMPTIIGGACGGL